MRVLIAGHHVLARAGLRHILAGVPDIVVGADAPNWDDLLEKAQEGPWDLVMFEINMPGRSGLEILRSLRTRHPKLPVLVFSLGTEDELAIRALKAGASGYITAESPMELIAAMRRAAAGRKYLSPRVAEKLAIELGADSDKPPHELLSNREFEILCRIASGKTVTDIGSEMSLSVKTISSYRARILKKMRMRNNAELMHYAVRNHLVA